MLGALGDKHAGRAGDGRGQQGGAMRKAARKDQGMRILRTPAAPAPLNLLSLRQSSSSSGTDMDQIIP